MDAAIAATFAYFAGAERIGETKDFSVITQEAAKVMQDLVLKKHGPIESYPLLTAMQAMIMQAIPEKVEDSEESPPKNCDQIFCEYLREVSKVTNPEYFANVVKFVILYRECANEYGWIKFAPKLGLPAPEDEKVEKKKEQGDYTATNNPEFIPELSNELVLSYLPEHNCSSLSAECTNLVINFCEWLLNNGYTCTKVIIVQK